MAPPDPPQFAAAYTIDNIKIQSPERKRRATGRQPQHAAARVSRTVAHAGIVFGLLETVVLSARRFRGLTVVLSARRFRSGLCICVLNSVHGREGAIFSQPQQAVSNEPTRFQARPRICVAQGSKRPAAGHANSGDCRGRVHETSSVRVASSCVERNASESRRSLRALRYAN